MSTWYYTFQLSRIHCIENRSSLPDDIDILTFGVLLNQRDQGHGALVVPIFRDSTLTPDGITEQARANGYGTTFSGVRMGRNWLIGPTEVNDGDGVDVVVTATNTNDSQLPTADQQKIDEMEIKALNIYYSWLLGEFASGLGLSAIAEYFGQAGGAIGAFLADPVGTLLGYEPQGPCNGLVFGGRVSLNSRELEALDWAPDPIQWATGPMDAATVTRSFDDAATHPAEHCGPTAQTEVDVTIRRSATWSMQKHNWDHPVRSVRETYPDSANVKGGAGLRL